MSLGLSRAPVRTFRCPYCNNTINTSLKRCSFCGNLLDHNWAEAAANFQDKINRACSDASYIRIAAQAMAGSFLFKLIPIIGIAGTVLFFFLAVAIPIMSIVWAARFLSLRSEEPDFKQAKRSMLVALGIWAALVFVQIFLEVVMFSLARS